MAVIAPAGVVGRLVVPSLRSAKVQLLIDRNAAAGAIIERTRAQGVVVGGGDDRLRLDYVSEVSDVVVGDVVVTSGIDGIYPKGLRHRTHRVGRADRRRLQAHRDQAGGRFLGARGSAGRADADAGARSGRRRVGVKAAGVILAVAVALALQTTAARFLVRGSVAVDLVLVVVVYVALTSGPATGLLSGAFAGLVQDALSSSVIGIGGLAKTLVGFLAGIIGTQFIVTASLPRFVVFFARHRAARGRVHGAVHAAGSAAFRHAVWRRWPARRPPTRSSAWWRSSWSSCCLERWSGVAPASPGCGDDIVK